MPTEITPGRLSWALVTGGTRKIGDKAWRAPCLSEDGEGTVIIKLLDARSLVTEAICAIVGRALKLPIPKPYFILIEPGQLGPGFPAAPCVAFGSREEPYPSIWSYTRDKDLVLGLLRKWRHVHDAAAFDTWIANADRTGKNMLIGTECALWLIDHDDAMPSHLPPDGGCANEIIAELRRDLSEWNLLLLKKKIEGASGQYPLVDLVTMASELENSGSGIEAAKVVAPLTAFLSERLQHLLTLINEQVGAKQTDAFLHAAHDRATDPERAAAGVTAPP